MTRPGFLVLTAVACLLGFATASASNSAGWTWPEVLTAAAALLLALLAHAAANVLNDYHDALNGADAANQDGLFPFTGGARLIQNGEVSTQDTRRLAVALLTLVVPAGGLLAWHSGSGLIGIGLAGLLLGWAYSAPPLALMTRGLGELAVAASWGLVVVGADYTLRGDFAPQPALAGVGLGLLAANILLINGVPDARADAAVGKRTLVVQLGKTQAARLYLVLAVLAHLWLLVAVVRHELPGGAAWGLVSLPLSLGAAHQLARHTRPVSALRPAIVLTIAAAVLHALAMSLGLQLWP